MHILLLSCLPVLFAQLNTCSNRTTVVTTLSAFNTTVQALPSLATQLVQNETLVLVTWQAQTLLNGFDIFATLQAFKKVKNGMQRRTVKSSWLLNTNVKYDQVTPLAIALKGENFVILYGSRIDTTGAGRVLRNMMQVVDNRGGKVGEESDVSGLVGEARFDFGLSAVALPQGGFAVSWLSFELNNGSPGQGTAYIRFFDQTGSPLRNATRVNSFDVSPYSAASSLGTSLSLLAENKIAVMWPATNECGTSYISLQYLRNTGDPVGSEVRTKGGDAQFTPDMIGLPKGQSLFSMINLNGPYLQLYTTFNAPGDTLQLSSTESLASLQTLSDARSLLFVMNNQNTQTSLWEISMIQATLDLKRVGSPLTLYSATDLSSLLMPQSVYDPNLNALFTAVSKQNTAILLYLSSCAR